jgi:hypothetical protein
MKIGIYLFILLTLVACKSIQEPVELISFDGTQIEQFSGQLVKFKASFHIQNKLWVPVKMKPGSFEVFIDQQEIGDLYLDTLIKIRGHRETELTVPLRMIPEPGFIATAYKAAKKPIANVKISGFPKAGVLFIYKSFPISKEAQIEPAQFIPFIPTF